MDIDPTSGFRKLSHLLQAPPFPPPTFCNILMLYCKPQHAFYDLAADIMAENTDLVATSLSKVSPCRLQCPTVDTTQSDVTWA